jgi:hypothetical protein
MDTSPSASLRAQWVEVAKILGIEAHGPELVRGAKGESYEFSVLLPQFGPPRGMLLHPTYDAEAFVAATSNDYGVSILDPEFGASIGFATEGAIDCLLDWGWSHSDPPPSWYAEHQQKTRDNVV